MKNLFKNLMLVAVAAMGFTACEQVGVESVAPGTPEVKMTVIAGMDETRTTIDEDNKIVKWSEGDKLMVVENEDTFRKTTDIAIDGNKAMFAVAFPATNGAVTYNAVFPASAVNTGVDFTAEELELQVKSTQWATADSFDPTADLLVAKQLQFDAQPEELNMQFKRIVALGKMTLKGLDEGAVKQVIFAAEPGVNVAGRCLVNATTATVLEYANTNASTSITVNYEEGCEVSGDFPVYFTCIPFEMEEMNCFTVQVICDNAVYTREVEIPSGRSLKFTAGNLATFTVDMAEGEKVEVEAATFATDTLTRATTGVTDTNYTSWSGKTGASGAVYAGNSAGGNESIQLRSDKSNSGIVTTTSGGYARKITVTWNSNTNAARTLDIYGKNTAYTNATNLYSTETQGTKIGSIKKGTTEFEITDDYAFIGLRSNSGAMYLTEIKIEWQTGGGSGDGVEIVTPSFDLDQRQLSYAVEGGSQNITVVPIDGFDNIVSAETSAEWLSIVNDGYTFTVTAEANEGFARTANITFSADGCEDIVVAVSQKPNYNAAKEVTIAEFKAAKEDDTTLYRLRGTITSVVETTYGNFDITDETGTVYIYGLCSPEGAQKYWGDSGAQLGDDIELITVRTSYSNTPQGKNAIFVEKQRPGTIAFWSFDKTSASFTSDGGEVKINVAAYNLKEDVNLAFKAGEDGDLFEAEYENGVLTIRAEANTATEALNATLYVRSSGLEQIITISQAAYVEGGDDEPVLVEKTATLSFANKAQRTTFTTTQQIWEQNGIKLTNDKASSTNAVADYANPARFYAGSKLTLDAPGAIKSIKFTCNSSSYATAMKNGIGTVSGATVTVSGSDVTVTFTEATAAQFVVAKLTAQVRMNSLSVTYMGEEE
ncbi:MAG: BACON domain-containing protein [Alistipes sp.]|nr:BACON domain-containing protein [Alistipes sp.]